MINDKYGLEPLKKADLHRKLNQQERKQLPAIFSRHSQRVVHNDFTFKFNNFWYQLSKDQPATIRPKDRVIVEERIDNQNYVRLRGKYLNYQITLNKPSKRTKQPWIIAANQKPVRKPYKPSANHPWKKFVINPKPAISKSSLHPVEAP